jgi:ABC-type sugar transport system ATPase subunit
MAIDQGISTVFQDLSLVECRDVTSNIFLGREESWGPFIRKRRMEAMARGLLESLKIDIPFLNIPVGLLSGGQRQAVAVARAIRQGGRLIIMDEPTAAMGLRESATVLTLIERLRSQGFAVVLISHNLHNVFSVADRICVMRHGRVIGMLNRCDTFPEEVVGMITGVRRNGETADD